MSGIIKFLLLLLIPFWQLFSQKSAEIVNMEDPRKIGSYVYDSAGLLESRDIEEINDSLRLLEKKTGAQFLIVITSNLKDFEPKPFAVELFNTWKIGRKKYDDGLLLLIVKERRRWEFETGYGLEGVLNDAFLKQTGEDILVPAFKKSEYGKGLLLTVNSIDLKLKKEYTASPVNESRVKNHKTNKKWKNSIGISYDAAIWIISIIGLIYFILCIWSSVYNFLNLKNAANIYKKTEEEYEICRNLKYEFHNFPNYQIYLFPIPLFFIFHHFKSVFEESRRKTRSCNKCRSEMMLLSQSAGDLFLTPKQKANRVKLKAEYDVWQCKSCGELKIYPYWEDMWVKRDCMSCKSNTVDKRIIDYKPPTRTEEGYYLWENTCLSCGFEVTEKEIVQKINFTPVSSSSSDSTSSYSYSSSDSSSSSSSSDSGGSSGGGGSGGDW